MDFPHPVRTVTAFARQALSEAARTHWPYLWANKHVNSRQRQYLTSSCVRGSRRGRMCLWSLACTNLSFWLNEVHHQNAAYLVSIMSIFWIYIGTIIQEDEFLNTLAFIRDSRESQCDMPLHRTHLVLSVLLMRSARTDSCSEKWTWSLNAPGLWPLRPSTSLSLASLKRQQSVSWTCQSHDPYIPACVFPGASVVVVSILGSFWGLYQRCCSHGSH